MARNEVEHCIMCSPDPCTCVAKPAPKARQKVQAVKQQEPVQQRRTAITQTTVSRVSQDEDIALRRAITLFAEAGMLSADTVLENMHYLDMSPTEAKLLIWKLRRQEWIQEQQVK